MGAWGFGAFDNDGAGELHAALRNAEPQERAGILREALEAAANATEYLEVDDGQAAVAAAAVVTAALGGVAVVATDSGARLEPEELPAPTAELIGLSRLALDRVVGRASEWRELWAEAESLDVPLEVVAEIRGLLGVSRS